LLTPELAGTIGAAVLEDRTGEGFGVEQLHGPMLDQASPGTLVEGIARESLEHDARDPGPP
jgi:hypothetical protein